MQYGLANVIGSSFSGGHVGKINRLFALCAASHAAVFLWLFLQRGSGEAATLAAITAAAFGLGCAPHTITRAPRPHFESRFCA